MTLDEAKRRYPGAETFTFGDNEELCDWLLQLVREGKKQPPAERCGISEKDAR